MKKVILLLLIAIAMFGADSEGFRDLKWGEPFNQKTKDFIIKYNDLSSKTITYIKKNDKLEIATAKLLGIDYLFFDNKFEGVNIKFEGYSNFISLKDTLTAKYGEPSRPNQFMNTYYWFGGNTIMGIIYNDISGKGSIFMSNKALYDQQEQYKKDIASKGVKDL
jgi:hypothetical protein